MTRTFHFGELVGEQAGRGLGGCDHVRRRGGDVHAVQQGGNRGLGEALLVT